MSTQDEETEAKFYVRNLSALPPRILAAGGSLVLPRTHEFNLRLDTAAGDLQRQRRVLRLRRDRAVRITYKDGGRIEDGAVRRREVELEVSDFDEAHELLRALGFDAIFTYEKYRTTYALAGVEIMLDELPFGDFVEIEGPWDSLKPAAVRLQLDWQAAIPYSYHDLFEQLRAKQQLGFADLTFANFVSFRSGLEALGLRAADGQV